MALGQDLLRRMIVWQLHPTGGGSAPSFSWWVCVRGFMLSLTPDPVILFCYIDELEVERESPRYPLKFSGAELFYPIPKFAILVGIIGEPEALTHQSDVFLGLVE